MRRRAAGVIAALVLLVAVPAHADRRIVRGGGGQPDLALDYGRSLGRLERGGTRMRATLSSIERARLEARRLAGALPTRAALERLVALVREHLPSTPDARYDHFNATQPSDGAVPLSAYVEERVGICRERAFLLAKLLRDGGMRARVRYGVLYDRRGGELGGHAWVEVTIAGHVARIDPNAAAPIAMRTTPQRVTQVLADGRSRTVIGMRSRTWLYVPEPVGYRRDEDER